MKTKKHMQQIIRSYIEDSVQGCVIPLDDSSDVIKVLRNHPRWAEKIEGASHLTVKWIKAEGHTTNKCFHIVWPDGSSDDISWTKALTNCTKEFMKSL